MVPSFDFDAGKEDGLERGDGLGEGLANERAGNPSSSPRSKVGCSRLGRDDLPRDTSMMGKGLKLVPSIPSDTTVYWIDQGSGTTSPGRTLEKMRYAVPTAIAILPRALHYTWRGVSWMFAVSNSSSLVIAMSGTDKGFELVAGISAKESRFAWKRRAVNAT